MRLSYKVLWFEDTDSSYKTLSSYVKEYLQENGFIPEIDWYRNDDEGIYNILSKADYDLILMDYHLLGTNGETVIENIRNQELYTEIVFYSQSGAQVLRESIGSRGIDGVYCTSRQISEFEDKVIKVIRNTIKKVQDINNMRGLVIAEAIDLETRIKMILRNYFMVGSDSVSLDEKRLRVYKGICERKVLQNDEEGSFLVNLPNMSFNDLLEKDYFLTSMNLFFGLQSALKEDIREVNLQLSTKLEREMKISLETKRTVLNTLKNELTNFEKDIIKLRNTLAHVEEKIDSEGTYYLESLNKNGLEIKFTNEKYIEIRKTIYKHSENLNKIMELFNPAQIPSGAVPTME